MRGIYESRVYHKLPRPSLPQTPDIWPHLGGKARAMPLWQDVVLARQLTKQPGERSCGAWLLVVERGADPGRCAVSWVNGWWRVSHSSAHLEVRG